MEYQLHAVIPAGGAGTRLWPLSRRDHPKFLLDLTSADMSLLQATVERLAPVVASTTIVTGTAHADAVRSQLAAATGEIDVLTEPVGRNSMGAIGLAAAVLVRRHGPDAILGSFAADHVIKDAEAFHQAVREAVRVAATGRLVTLGITPTYAATGFGYIHAGNTLDVPGAPNSQQVAAFVEKPDAATAQAYVAQGRLWNAGMFVCRAGVLLDHLARLRPALAAGLGAIGAAWDEGEAARQAALDEHWADLENIAIDHALAEPLAAEGHVAVVPMDVGWDDVGDIAALAKHLPALGEVDGGSEETATRVLGDPARVHVLDAPGAIVAVAGAGQRDIVVLGAADLVVVDTSDALLVTTRDQAQRVREVVDLLRAQGRTELL